MPIYNDSEQSAGRFDGFPVVCVIRKGAPKTERGAGAPLDHFRFDLKPGYEEYAADLEQIYGERPNLIPNVLLVGGNTSHKVFPHWMMQFSGNNVLVNKCDGRTNVLSLNKATGLYDNTEKPCLRNGPGCTCTEHGYLRFFLPEFSLATGVLGLFMVPVSGKIEINRTRAFLHSLEALGVDLAATPFMYARQPESIKVPAPGKGRINTTKHIARLEIMPEAMKQIAAGVSTAALTAPAEADVEDLQALPEGEPALENGVPMPSETTWDYETVYERALAEFDWEHEAHCRNSIAAAATLLVMVPTHNTETAWENFRTWRLWRIWRKEENLPESWTDDPAVAHGMCNRAWNELGLTQTEVLAALRINQGKPLNGLPDFAGTKQDAWDALLHWYNEKARLER